MKTFAVQFLYGGKVVDTQFVTARSRVGAILLAGSKTGLTLNQFDDIEAEAMTGAGT